MPQPHFEPRPPLPLWVNPLLSNGLLVSCVRVICPIYFVPNISQTKYVFSCSRFRSIWFSTFFLLSLRGEFNADKRCEIKFAKLSFGRRYRNCQDSIRSGGVRESQTKEMFYELGCWQPLELWQRWYGEKRLGQPGEKPDNTSVHQCPKHEILGEYRGYRNNIA